MTTSGAIFTRSCFPPSAFLLPGMKLLLFGIFAGALLTLAAGKEAAALLYDLKPYDPAIMIAAALGLSAVAIAASLLPARRAAHLQPTVALREE